MAGPPAETSAHHVDRLEEEHFHVTFDQIGDTASIVDVVTSRAMSLEGPLAPVALE